MQLIKWEPFKEVERFFDDRFSLLPTFSRLGLDLAVDVYEEKDDVVAKMSLPGVNPEEVEILVEENILTISGKREEEKEIDKKNYYSKEIHRGSFSRSINLPKSVDSNKAEAKFENGELVVVMPIVAGAKEKVVKIKIKK